MVDSSIRFMVDSSIHFKVVPTKSIPWEVAKCPIAIQFLATYVIAMGFIEKAWVAWSQTGLIKLLGVNLDAMLSFKNHVCNISIRAGTNLNVLKRVAKTMPLKVKLLLYKTYIYCHFNFCPLVWHFCGETNTKMLERLQYRALRFVFDHHESDYEDLLSRANMPSLELGRLRGLCTEVFKCINNLAPQYMCDLFQLQDKDLHNT